MAKAISLLLVICAYLSLAMAVPPNAYERTRGLDIRASSSIQSTTPSFPTSDSIHDLRRRGVLGAIKAVQEGVNWVS
jgi:hypothetical protein